MGFIISLIIFFFAVIIHEISHGLVAYKLGDPTAKYSGRLTLNPFVHIDPVGTIILPIVLILMNSPVIFGWAKPVPVNFWNLKNPQRDMIWVGLAGPLANILLGLLLILALKSPFTTNIFLSDILKTAIIINLVLAIFNLIPIPPLDGSRVLMGLLPRETAIGYSMLEPFGFLIVFMLLFFGLFERIIWPIVAFFLKILNVY
ncbi:MAG: site-2 protease family protein [Candidatus Omnitrophota bacterium]